MDSDQVGLLHLGSDLTSEAGSSVDKPSSSDLTSEAGSSVDKPSSSDLTSDDATSSIQVDRAVSSEVTSQAVCSIESQGPVPVPREIGISRRPHQPQLALEMENALLQQVLSLLTPQQINLLPLEQRNQVLELQQMLR